jgi:exoribonuclease II
MSDPDNSYASIIDFHNGQYCLFTGNSHINYENDKHCVIYGREIVNNVPTDKLAINIFVGMLHLSSKRVYTTKNLNGKVVVRKEFTPFNNLAFSPKYLVKIKKTESSPDVCAVIKVEYFDESLSVLYCEVIEYIGELLNINVDIAMIRALATSHWTNKLNKQFMTLIDIDLTTDRYDYTKLEIYSIDPSGCEDIDDALHCITTENGYEIGIHISDVSSFIEENSIFDIELSKRVSSIYLNTQINMIPSELSTNIMSLKEKTIKRAFSIILSLNQKFDITGVNFLKTSINVTKNLTYDQCQEIVNKKSNDNDCINNLYTIGNILTNKLVNRSDVVEYLDSSETYDTHQMVAIYMIYANKMVAEKISGKFPNNALLRTQGGSMTFSGEKVIDDVELLKIHKLSLLERAIYKIGITNSKHTGLNIPFYTHFTSPIRRYADILVHRQLWQVINDAIIYTPPVKTLFLLNAYSLSYKQIERYYHLIQIINNIKYDKYNDFTLIEEYAHIVSINNNENKVRLYINNMKLTYDLTLIHNKLKHLVSTNLDNNILKIININSGDELILKLFQKVKIIMSITQKSINKLNIIICEPDISLFLSI